MTILKINMKIGVDNYIQMELNSLKRNILEVEEKGGDNMGVNFKLRGARAEKGFTQGMLAEAIGLSRFGYFQKEKGINSFTEIEIKRICQVLEKNVTDIFFN